MKQVVSVEQMRMSDRAAIASGTSAEELMARAAAVVFRSYPWRGRVCIVCGSGNNGGDGYALALLLREANIPCRILALADPATEACRLYAGRCREAGIQTDSADGKPDFSGDGEIVDGIFGTGFHGVADGIFRDVIEAINESGKPVVSIDINSGMNGDSGLGTVSVKSLLTVSIGSLKPGHFLGDAKDRIGELQNADIGIPVVGNPCFLLEESDAGELFPLRRNNSHKGDYGYVGILGGCAEYAGAAKLAALGCAALRSGCGVATVAVPESIAPAVAPHLLETTLFRMPDRGGWMQYDPESMDRFLSRMRAVSVGMGWGSGSDYPQILGHLATRYSGAVVLDADALNTLAGMDLSILRSFSGRAILTPHPKELERISGIPTDRIRQNPIETARNFAAAYGVVVLLKGATTVVTDGKTTYLSNRGCPGMATAGSGDVLSGILTGLLGYLPPTALTAACGAYLAGMAGELAQRESNPISMTASDTVRAIPAAISQLLAKTTADGTSSNE